MKERITGLWGIVNGARLIVPTIRKTRRGCIRDYLESSQVGGVRPSPSNLKRHCPWAKCAYLDVRWTEGEK